MCILNINGKTYIVFLGDFGEGGVGFHFIEIEDYLKKFDKTKTQQIHLFLVFSGIVLQH